MTDQENENIFTRVYSQTSGLLILLVIALLGAWFTMYVLEATDRLHDVLVENLDPHKGYNDVEL